MFQELLKKLQKPMTVEQRANLLDEALLALIKDRAVIEALDEKQADIARNMGKEYY